MKAQPTTASETPVVPQVLDAWVLTDFWGNIHDISPAAAAMISMSAAGAYGRQIQLFFVADRQEVLRDMRCARDGMTIESVRTLKPRERRAMTVRVEIAVDDEVLDHLLWRLHRAS
jgi:hypothetical protein